jgi:hypothetical protein
VTWTYDPAGRLVARAHRDAADTPRTTTYTYTGAGSAWTATDASGAYTVTLDRAGRTTAIDDPFHAANWTFSYGANPSCSIDWPHWCIRHATLNACDVSRLPGHSAGRG